MKTIGFFIFCIWFCTLAQAAQKSPGTAIEKSPGTKVFGGGGYAVSCPGKTEVYDIHEARKRGLHLDLGAPNVSLSEKIRMATRRLAQVDPYRAAIIQIMAENFMNDAVFLDGIEVGKIDDVDELFLEKNCFLEQVAKQREKIVNSDPYYVISNDLWKLLDRDNQATLILHEIIYRASHLDLWPSNYARLLTSLAVSSFTDTHSAHQYYEFIAGTPLAETVIIKRYEAQWYFQIPQTGRETINLKFGHSFRGSFTDYNPTQGCTKYGGHVVTFNDLQVIQKMLKQEFAWGTWGVTSPVYGPGNTKAFDKNIFTALTDTYDKMISPVTINPYRKLKMADKNAEAEIWCKSDTMPLLFGIQNILH